MNKDKGIYFRATQDERNKFNRRKMLLHLRDLLELPYPEYQKVIKYTKGLKNEQKL